ncbi:alpha/beta hydrolase [Micromonospora sp. HUAS YX12]|uniref:Alpha/beta hydrolase n=1 Tax=Micromonospora sp. HUAS YX12 TaxID=3156396 RepID=A0AAU7QW91_9ACTN
MTPGLGTAAALLAAGPLLRVLPPPVRVRCADPATAAALARLCERLDVPAPTPVTAAADLGPFERVVSDLLDLDANPAPAAADEPRVVADARERDFTCRFRRTDVRTGDGAVLPTYAAGDPDRPPVLLVSACGMPARLAEGWADRLSRDFHVLVPETRGLFADVDGFTGDTGAVAQADDLLAVLDRFGLRRAHLIGLCGGAVLAVVAAARAPERVSSLSLWHGDFDLGDESPKTDHQQNLQALMAMAARSPQQAAAVHAVLTNTMLGVAPPRLAHLVTYPYATPELLRRYCRLNGAIMGTDLRPYLAGLTTRTLVVTSEDDHTAHPAGSRAVAARIAGSVLHVAPHGDHLSLFHAEDGLVDLAARFVAGDDALGTRSPAEAGRRVPPVPTRGGEEVFP